MCVCVRVCVVVVGVRTEDMCTKARGRPICVCAALAPLRRVTGVKHINASAPIPHRPQSMSVLSRWHIQRCAPKLPLHPLRRTRDTGAPYLFKFSTTTRVFGQKTSPSTKSCAIALRSPASERPSDLKRYSPGIHNPRHASSYIPHIPHHIPPSHATPSQLSNIYPLQPINESGRHQEKGTDGHSAGAWA